MSTIFVSACFLFLESIRSISHALVLSLPSAFATLKKDEIIRKTHQLTVLVLRNLEIAPNMLVAPQYESCQPLFLIGSHLRARSPFIIHMRLTEELNVFDAQACLCEERLPFFSRA